LQFLCMWEKAIWGSDCDDTIQIEMLDI
jgi:hypothetical protein